MKRKKIQQAIDSRLKKMEFLAEKIRGGFVIEDIHLFRLEVKKLRAFLRLIQDVQNRRKSYLPKHIKELFKLLGTIRELQLQGLRIRHSCKQINGAIPPVKYLALLRNEKEKATAETYKLLTRIDLFRQKNLISKMPKKISGIAMSNYLSSQNDKLLALISMANPSDLQLHLMRKIFKDILYLHLYVPNKKKNAPNHFFSRKETKKITTMLGNHQDLCRALALLGPAYLNKISSLEEHILLPTIRKQLQNEKKEIRTQIGFARKRALSHKS